jgi:hypothetical protein
MKVSSQLFLQQAVYHLMALNPAFTVKLARNNSYGKMRLAAARVPPNVPHEGRYRCEYLKKRDLRLLECDCAFFQLSSSQWEPFPLFAPTRSLVIGTDFTVS